MSSADEQHPIVLLLSGIMPEVRSRDAKSSAAGLAKLQALIDEEGDIRMHRAYPLNAQSKALVVFINTALSQLLESAETRLAGVRAVAAFLDVEFTDVTTRTRLFSQLLLGAAVDQSVTSAEALAAWGRLMANNCGITGDIARDQLRRVLALLSEDRQTSDKRFVAAMILLHLAERAPAVIGSSIGESVRGILQGLADASEGTRDAASSALRQLLVLVVRSDASRRTAWLQQVLEFVATGLGARVLQTQHGAWLALNALLTVVSDAIEAAAANAPLAPQPPQNSAILTSSTAIAPPTGITAAIPIGIPVDLMNQVWSTVVVYISKMPTAVQIRREVHNAIPQLARFDPPLFRHAVIAEVLQAAVGTFRNPQATSEERGQMFLTIGHLGSVLPDQIPLYVARVVRNIEVNLVPSKKPPRERCPEAVTCLTRLASADPASVRPFVMPLLSTIFTGQPTVAFATNIASLCSAFPELRSTCLDRILAMVRLQLQSVPPRSGLASAADEASSATLMAAFAAIGALNFDGYSMLTFLSTEVAPRLWDPDRQVRRAAADLCARLLLCGCNAPGSPCRADRHGTVIHVGAPHITLVLRLQQQLVAVAVADPEADIRLATLTTLTEPFDHTLCMQECVRGVFPALNDKHANRAAAVALLGRLSRRNPAAVLPTLRKVLVQCMTDIEYFREVRLQQQAGNERRLEQAIVILGAVVEAAPLLVQPYRPSLLRSTVERLRVEGTSTVVQSALLACIGKLVQGITPAELPVVRELRPVVVAHVIDGSSTAKRQCAIQTLVCIVRATRDIGLYDEFPSLLPTLLAMLHGGSKEVFAVRRDVLSLIGVVGAVDPVKVKAILRHMSTREGGEGGASTLRARTEDLPHIVLNAVLGVMRLPSVNEETLAHAAQALVDICASGAVKTADAITYLPRIIGELRRHIALSPRLRERFIKELAAIVAHFRHHIRPHLDDLFLILTSNADTDDPAVLRQCIALVGELRACLHEEFKPLLPALLPLLVSTLQNDRTPTLESTVLVLRCFDMLGKLLDGHLHVVLPAVLGVAARATPVATEAREQALVTITQFAKHLPTMSDHAARCVHCALRVLQEPLAPVKVPADSSGVGGRASAAAPSLRPHSLHVQCLQAILCIAQNLGDGFSKFVPVVRPALSARFGEGSREHAEAINTIRQALLSGKRTVHPEPPRHGRSFEDGSPGSTPARSGGAGSAGGPPSTAHVPEAQRFAELRQMLSSMDRLADDEAWKVLLRQFSVELLRASSSRCLRACVTLAQAHEPFARTLFYPAFASCFAEMTEMRVFVGEQMSKILASERASSEVQQEILNLAEFMERVEEYTPKSRSQRSSNQGPPPSFTTLLDVRVLSNRSEAINLHAKAVHYLEAQFMDLTKEFHRSLNMGRVTKLQPAQWELLLEVSERCINLCNLLGLGETANGILSFIRRHYAALSSDVSGQREFEVVSAEMYEKLQWWSQSLRAFEQRLRADPQNMKNAIGVMTALGELGDYPKLLEVYRGVKRRGARKALGQASVHGARAAWLMQSWADMSAATDMMPSEGYNATTAVFYRAVLAAHRGNGSETQRYVEECRKHLDTSLTALVAESYERAYRLVVGLQQLCELEEVMLAKRDPSTLPHWRDLWHARLVAMAQDPAEWQGTLANHSMVLGTHEELPMWLQFVSLCRNRDRGVMAQEVLHKLLGGRAVQEVVLSTREPAKPPVALAALTHLYETGRREESLVLLRQYIQQLPQGSLDVAACRARLSEWLTQTSPHYYNDAELCKEITTNLKAATALDPSNGSTWHQWARLQHDQCESLIASGRDADAHVVSALEGYLNSVRASQQLQDVLGLLSLWFSHGHKRAVDHVISAGIPLISVNVWLGVVPQIIARIHNPSKLVKEAVYNLLVAIARVHPQALLYTLNVNHNANGADESPDTMARREASQRILTRIQELHGDMGVRIVEEARMVCEELNRCSVLWSELWVDELLRIHEQWESDNDIQRVARALAPLTEMLDNPTTACEESFVAEYALHLREGAKIVADAAAGKGSVDRAWELFDGIIRKIGPQNKSISSLVLEFVSQRLVSAGKDLAIVMPGQYTESQQSPPRIAAFAHEMKLLHSKQRPRRMAIIGSDGLQYRYLLKGHEDLRQDERVMQLLGLVNTVLEGHNATRRRNYTVQLFSITPLGDNAGLVGWVDDCETIHAVIKEYRAIHKIPLATEMNAINSITDDQQKLQLVQKQEAFETSLESTEGLDIARSMWARAPSAEQWLDNRTTYVRTLACMSMVGHILGLGDRHPSNLMLHGQSGRVVHIDFGDCFEVAMNRAVFPEKVPFRLTRMLIRAMEICGIDGLYRHGCDSVMSVLRKERNSLLAMLEAFVHDPLVSWRLDETDGPGAEGTAAAAGTDANAAAPGAVPQTAGVMHQPRLLLHREDDASLVVGSLAEHQARTLRSIRFNPHVLATAQAQADMAAGGQSVAVDAAKAYNKQAQKVIGRVREKLTGTEFAAEAAAELAWTMSANSPMASPVGRGQSYDALGAGGAGAVSSAVSVASTGGGTAADGIGGSGGSLTVPNQVSRLITEATSSEHLCQHFLGWCAYW